MEKWGSLASFFYFKHSYRNESSIIAECYNMNTLESLLCIRPKFTLLSLYVPIHFSDWSRSSAVLSMQATDIPVQKYHPFR